MASKACRTMAATAVALALMGVAATAPANAVPVDPNDPQCNVNPELASCFGGPLGVPTSPSDPQCALGQGDAICKGGPFDHPGPPAMGSGLPGSINYNGTAAGSYQAPDIGAMHPDMGGFHPGMGGIHPGMGGMHPGMGGMHMGGPGHA